MNVFHDIVDRRPGEGAPVRELLRDDREWAVCFSCPRKHGRNVRHPLRGNNADHDFKDFACRHPDAAGHIVLRIGPQQMENAVRRAERRKRAQHEALAGFLDNASVLEAFQSSDQSVDLTSFNSLASSATAGWSSHYIDNSSNLYLDYIAYIKIAAVNTAPANNKAAYLFAATALNTTDLPASGASSGNTVPNSSSTSAALTFPSIATPLPCLFGAPIRVLQYPVQNIANTHPNITVARYIGPIGLYLWFPLLNYTGMTFAASGNVFKYRGVYSTVS